MLMRNQFSSNESFPSLLIGNKDDSVIKSQGNSSNFRKELPLQCGNSPISASQFPTVLHMDDIGPSLPTDLHLEEITSAATKPAKEKSDAEPESPPEAAVIVEKPFFIMDFLDNVDSEDLELAQYMLQNSSSNVGNHESLRESIGSPQSLSIYNNLLQKLRPARAKESSVSSAKTVIKEQSGSKSKDEPLLRRNKSSFFDWSVAIGTKYNTKGICCASKGDWKKALQYWEDALEIRSQVLGESLDVANTCNNIGIALGKLNRYEEAITSLQRAINIRIAHYGWYHEIIAATLHNMGNVYQQQKQSDDDTSDCLSSAIYCFREAEYILQKVHGRNHAEVARSLVAVGHTYNQAHERDEARKAYLEALHIFEIIGYTIDHPEIQSILDDLNGLE